MNKRCEKHERVKGEREYGETCKEKDKKKREKITCFDITEASVED